MERQAATRARMTFSHDVGGSDVISRVRVERALPNWLAFALLVVALVSLWLDERLGASKTA